MTPYLHTRYMTISRERAVIRLHIQIILITVESKACKYKLQNVIIKLGLVQRARSVTVSKIIDVKTQASFSASFY